MKKTLIFVAAVAAFAGALLVNSCKKDDVATIPIVKVEVVLPDGFSATATYSGAVTMTDKTTGKVLTANAEASVATFKNVPYGSYSVAASAIMANADFKAAAPEISASVTADIALNSTPVDVVLAKDDEAAEPIKVTVIWSVPSSLVISRIYNFGTQNLAGKAYNIDKYIEIYNTSAETVYADGLYLGEAYGSVVTASPYTNVATANVCYMQRVVRIPGTGNQYPIEPGKSIVIAQNAKNHIDAEVITNTVDLSGADFECYVTGAPASMFPADNAEVPNIEEIFGATSSQAKFFAGQGTIPVLFRMEASAFEALETETAPGYEAYPQYAPNCKKLPVSAILDAVDGVRIGYEARKGSHVPASVDAGNAPINQKNITLRKIAYFAADGRAVLQDTNNSSADFVIVESTDGTILVPRKYDVAQIQPAAEAQVAAE